MVLAPKGSKSYTIIKTRMVQKYFDIVTMKQFHKGDEVGKFSKTTIRSGYIVTPMENLDSCLRGFLIELNVRSKMFCQVL